MNPTRHLRFVLPAILCLVTFNAVHAQEKQKLTLETMNDPTLRQAFVTPRTWWLDDNTAIIFDTRKLPAEQQLERLDPQTGKRTPLLDQKKASESFKNLFPEGKAPRFSPVPDAFSGTGTYGFYLIDGDVFLLDIKNATVTRVTETKEEEKDVDFSPDGLKLAFVRGNNLYAYDIPQKKESRLTEDGSDTILNGTLSWVYWEEIFERQDIGYWWSPDSRSIAYLRTDESGVSLQHFVNISPWTPTVTTQRYPKVGEKNPDVRVGIVEIGATKTAWVNIDPKAYEYIVRVKWLPDNKRVSVRTMNRLQTEEDMYFVDCTSGEAKFIEKETNEAWVNTSDDLCFLHDGEHFIRSSERDGYEHLYRFTMDGKLVNQITKGDWAIHSAAGGVFWLRRAVTGIDEKDGWIYFTALEKSPLEKHLYRIKMDGGDMKRLTDEDGTHSISMSPNAKFYFDRYASISTPPSLTLYVSDGSKKLVLAESDLGGFKKYEVHSSQN